MMILASRPGFFRLLRLSTIALASTLLCGQAVPPSSQRITFPYENVSDLRGLLNAFGAFKRACLAQPVTEDLPGRLVPDGYQTVSGDFYFWGTEGSAFHGTTFLSKTGTEEDDFAGGHPAVELKMPKDNTPDGGCKVIWKRAWDYDEGVERIMFGMAAVFSAQISFHLQAILISRPDDSFSEAKSYGLTQDWVTPCWGGNPCIFKVIAFLDPKDGIYLTIERR